MTNWRARAIPWRDSGTPPSVKIAMNATIFLFSRCSLTGSVTPADDASGRPSKIGFGRHSLVATTARPVGLDRETAMGGEGADAPPSRFLLHRFAAIFVILCPSLVPSDSQTLGVANLI